MCEFWVKGVGNLAEESRNSGGVVRGFWVKGVGILAEECGILAEGCVDSEGLCADSGGRENGFKRKSVETLLEGCVDSGRRLC